MNNKFLNLIFINIVILFGIFTSSLIVIELIFRTRNPYSLFPEELTEKKDFTLSKRNLKIYDGKKNEFRFEPKTNVSYRHNKIGFRINKNEKSDINSNKNLLRDSIISFGDSTSYGLNIENKDTFTSIISEELSASNSFNFSYPGMNLDTISYKINCTSKLLNENAHKTNLSIVSIYYNDVEDLGLFNNFNHNKCRELNQVNLTNAIIKDTNNSNSSSEINKLSNFPLLRKIISIEKYPKYFDVILCRRLFSRSCKMIKFAIANTHPKMKSLIFGSHEVSDLYSNLNYKNKILLEKSIKNFKESLIYLSQNSKKLVLLYIPRHEADLINSKNNKSRERVFYLFNEICSNEYYSKKINCLDGTNIILNNLNEEEQEELLKKGRLPLKYYSYLPTYDMGHPSMFVSKLYAKEIIKLF